MKNALPFIPPEALRVYEAIILTEHLNLKGYYGIHTGRPAGGVPIFLKPTLGAIQQIIKEENTVIVKTSHITIIGIMHNHTARQMTQKKG